MVIFTPIQRFDDAVSALCLCHRFNLFTARVSRAISRTGDGHLYVIIGLFVFVFDALQGMAFVTAVMTAFAIERPIYFCLKNIFKRHRPSALPSFIEPSDRYSLPSGHTAAAFIMAALISQFYPALSWLVWPWAVCIGLSRVMLGVHFITDIIAGALLGLGTFYIVQVVL